MKIYRYVLIVLVLSMVAANAGHAASGPAPKNGGRSTASGKGGGRAAARWRQGHVQRQRNRHGATALSRHECTGSHER
jgi:hypothetical protein